MRYIFLLFTFFIICPLYSSDIIIDTVSLESKILNETRDIIIYKPANLHSSDTVEILYLLDGEGSGYRYNEVDLDLRNQLIGIGIVNTNRNRDLLPVKQADLFLEFIEKELMPRVEADYLICNRVLFGHSFGGCFTIYTMLNRPELFDKYMASSPTPIMDMTDLSSYRKLDTRLKNPVKFYFSYGSKDMKQVRKWAQILIDNLENYEFKNLQVKHEIFPGENHNSSDVISLNKGLKF